MAEINKQRLTPFQEELQETRDKIFEQKEVPDFLKGKCRFELLCTCVLSALSLHSGQVPPHLLRGLGDRN